MWRVSCYNKLYIRKYCCNTLSYCKLPFRVEMIIQFIDEYGSRRCFYISFAYW